MLHFAASKYGDPPGAYPSQRADALRPAPAPRRPEARQGRRDERHHQNRIGHDHQAPRSASGVPYAVC
jgi:hypothetical protein